MNFKNEACDLLLKTNYKVFLKNKKPHNNSLSDKKSQPNVRHTKIHH
jgi:hypothetical protein